MRPVRLASLLLNFLPALVSAADLPFECKYDGKQQEMNACAIRDYKSAELALNTKYKQIMSELPAAKQDELRREQRAWARESDSHCKAEAKISEGGSIWPLEFFGCLQTITEERTKQLERWRIETSFAANSLCAAKEEVVFSCPTSNKKVVSLCLSKNKLTYRFGTPRNIELAIQDPGPSSPSAFQYHHYSRAQVNRNSLFIEVPQANYELFDNQESELETIESSGVSATHKRSKRTVDILCVKNKVNANWYLIEGKVACSDQALNSCAPPAKR